jgi:hypothetical protein
MSLYKEYIEEITHGYVLETGKGFITYVFPDDDTCYIKDIYISPQYRKSHEGKQLGYTIQEIAVAKGCKYLLGSVVPSANGSTQSLKILLSFGYQLFSASPDFILFRKEL